MKRVFIGIKTDPSTSLAGMISSLRNHLKGEKINWVETANLHLTLAFIGDTDENRISNISDFLEKSCRDFKEFSFSLIGTGIFRNFHDPKVIWAGIDYSENLIQLQKSISNGLRDEGFDLEEREFKPHLTLGRIKFVNDKVSLKMVLNKYETTLFQEVLVKEIILFESILRPQGPLYKPLGKFELK